MKNIVLCIPFFFLSMLSFSTYTEDGKKVIEFQVVTVDGKPVKDAAVDILLSMNGLHVFPDKQRAIAEMRRVIREQGKLVACCYVEGGSKLSDWLVRHIGVRPGFFNAPFFHASSIASEFEGFAMTQQENIKDLAYFEAIKTS